jgi:hypothetical protein
MFCPNCGQERFSEATNFCSRCGYLLTGTADLLKMGGTGAFNPQFTVRDSNSSSPRSRGVKQGIFMMLLAVVLVPILGILLVRLVGGTPWPIGVIFFLLGGGGLLRMAYALMFEPGAQSALPSWRGESPTAGYNVSGRSNPTWLPRHNDVSAALYTAPATGRWRDTGDLESSNVTEIITKVLEKKR